MTPLSHGKKYKKKIDILYIYTHTDIDTHTQWSLGGSAVQSLLSRPQVTDFNGYLQLYRTLTFNLASKLDSFLSLKI